jgi:N-acetylglucosaminyldiphosphoundecaprenol N-acetyl-beta-D-mannosaminyltransferase
MERKEIISLNINIESYNAAVCAIIDLSEKRVSSYVCFANVHMIVESYKDEELKILINNSTFSFSDGKPLVWALKLLYNINQDRIAGIDFMIDTIKECEKKHLAVFLFGSTEIVLNTLAENLSKEFPNLVIAGKLSPPFKEFSLSENNSFIQTINNCEPNIVFVSLGCPKQEVWMAKHFNEIKAPLLGVGAAFEIHAKLIKRAPKWMQKAGLEWLFRFCKEPGRLWKRYTLTNTLFIYLLLKKIILPGKN